MRLRGIILLLALGAIWGSSFLFLKVVTPVIGVYMTVASRLIMAAVIMIVVFSFMKRLPDYRKYWKDYLILGLLNLIIPFGLVSYSITYLTSSTTAILNATTPLFALIIASIWLKERITIKKISGILMAIIGLVILVGWMPMEVTSHIAISITLSLLAALSYGIGSVYIKAKVKETDPMKTATGQVSAGALLILPMLFFQTPEADFGQDILISLLALGVICTALAYILFFKLIHLISSTSASFVTILVPVFSMLWGVLFLNEPVTIALLAGLALILTSLILVLSPTTKIEKFQKKEKAATLNCYYCLN